MPRSFPVRELPYLLGPGIPGRSFDTVHQLSGVVCPIPGARGGSPPYPIKCCERASERVIWTTTTHAAASDQGSAVDAVCLAAALSSHLHARRHLDRVREVDGPALVACRRAHKHAVRCICVRACVVGPCDYERLRLHMSAADRDPLRTVDDGGAQLTGNVRVLAERLPATAATSSSPRHPLQGEPPRVRRAPAVLAGTGPPEPQTRAATPGGWQCRGSGQTSK